MCSVEEGSQWMQGYIATPRIFIRKGICLSPRDTVSPSQTHSSATVEGKFLRVIVTLCQFLRIEDFAQGAILL
jgi:hypothetical protein